jgi:hypothetical protein
LPEITYQSQLVVTGIEVAIVDDKGLSHGIASGKVGRVKNIICCKTAFQKLLE